ncbi:MAG: hypothetical protein M1838_001983 [Thelocarpon superellum]|nr:MAG: hypothetical protein M1838_001983 [Thelocarpon superellum]
MTFDRHVGFVSTPTVSRVVNENELVAIHNFAVHASHCTRCADPYRTHLEGKTLCDRGHHHAREVARYVYNRAGRACSALEYNEHQPIQVEIPVGYEATRGLLKAMERGLRVRAIKAKAAPVVSYDRTYWVERRKVDRPVRPPVQIVEPTRRDHRFEKIVYVGPHRRDFPALRPHENIVVYAAPRQHRPIRPSMFFDDQFFR